MKNAINWFDVPSKDFDRAIQFYSEILGEEMRIQDFMGQKLGFFPMDQDGAVGGDLVPPMEGNEPSTTGTRVYLNCDGKLDEVIERVEAAGGKIVQSKYSIGDMGDIAMIEDTEGNIVGLHSAK